jgi:hypothetical protein
VIVYQKQETEQEFQTLLDEKLSLIEALQNQLELKESELYRLKQLQESNQLVGDGLSYQ